MGHDDHIKHTRRLNRVGLQTDTPLALRFLLEQCIKSICLITYLEKFFLEPIRLSWNSPNASEALKAIIGFDSNHCLRKL